MSSRKSRFGIVFLRKLTLCIASRIDTGMFRQFLLSSIWSESEDPSYATQMRSEREPCTLSTLTGADNNYSTRGDR